MKKHRRLVVKLISFVLVSSLYVTSGSFLTLALKWQGETQTKTSGFPHTRFRHPFFQVLVSKIGFFTAIVFVIAKRVWRCSNKMKVNQVTEINNVNSSRKDEIVNIDINENVMQEMVEISKSAEIKKSLQINISEKEITTSEQEKTAVKPTEDAAAVELEKDVSKIGSKNYVKQPEIQTKKASTQGGKPNELFFTIPSFFNLVGNVFGFYGIFLTLASFAQILNSTMTIFTSVFLVIFFRRKIEIYRWLGILVTFSGAVITGLSTLVLLNDWGGNYTNVIIGNIIVVVGVFFTSLQFVSEEAIYIRYSDIDTYEAVCLSGFWGIAPSFLLLLISSFATPNLDEPSSVVQELYEYPITLLFVIQQIVCVTLYNVMGNLLTKTMSASARSMVDSLRMILVWVIQILRQKESFEIVRFVGMMFVLVGNAIYFEVIPLRIVFEWVFGKTIVFEKDIKLAETGGKCQVVLRKNEFRVKMKRKVLYKIRYKDVKRLSKIKRNESVWRYKIVGSDEENDGIEIDVGKEDETRLGTTLVAKLESSEVKLQKVASDGEVDLKTEDSET